MGTDASFQQEFLDTHNAYRAKHNTPALTLSSELNASAQKWADHLLASNVLQHSNGAYGENVYNKSSSAVITPTGGLLIFLFHPSIKSFPPTFPWLNVQTTLILHFKLHF